MDFKEINDTADLSKHRNGVLILASVVALGDQERRDIQSFQEQGGAVLKHGQPAIMQKAMATGTVGNFCKILACRYLAKFRQLPEANHLFLQANHCSRIPCLPDSGFIWSRHPNLFRFKAEATVAQSMAGRESRP